MTPDDEPSDAMARPPSVAMFRAARALVGLSQDDLTRLIHENFSGRLADVA